jgi:hypothetical protein
VLICVSFQQTRQIAHWVPILGYVCRRAADEFLLDKIVLRVQSFAPGKLGSSGESMRVWARSAILGAAICRFDG